MEANARSDKGLQLERINYTSEKPDGTPCHRSMLIHTVLWPGSSLLVTDKIVGLNVECHALFSLWRWMV